MLPMPRCWPIVAAIFLSPMGCSGPREAQVPPPAPVEMRQPEPGQPTYEESVRWMISYAEAHARWVPGGILVESARVQEGRRCQLVVDKEYADRTRTTVTLAALDLGGIAAGQADGGQGCVWVRAIRGPALAKVLLDRTGNVVGSAQRVEAERICFQSEEQATRFAAELRHAARLCGAADR